jgi:uncharacterized phiE125 gp8 family phage protein
MLIDLAPPPAPAEAIAEVAAELRLPFGFDDDAERRAALAASAAAAVAIVERRTGRALIRRAFRLRLDAWSGPRAQELPVAPVASIETVVVENAAGLRVGADLATLRLDEASFWPRILARPPHALPAIPPDGFAEIAFTAGYGPSLGVAPADLRRAVVLIAAGLAEPTARPAADVAAEALMEPYRRIRL